MNMGNEKLLMEWPYPILYEQEKETDTDVLIIGGGIAGCFAAISAAKNGSKVAIVDKASIIRSGSGGSGVDHWHAACTNPCSNVTPDEMINIVKDYDYGRTPEYGLGITCYILCRESYETLLELEQMGAQVRDVDDEFAGAEFRDDETKLMFAYDYDGKHILRVCGSGFKPALYKELKRLGVELCEHIMITSLLNNEGRQGDRVIGATGVDVRTGEFNIFKSKATVLTTGRVNGLWDFSTEAKGLGHLMGDPNCAGDGHAIAWKAGAEFTMMEGSLPAGGTVFPPRYGTGNARNTWYACSIIDADGKEIPWVGRDDKPINTISERYRTAPGQKFFLYSLDHPNAPYEYRGPHMMPDLHERIMKGEFKLPFYADLPGMPKHERRAIFGLMVGNEGKTRIPVYDVYTKAGFNPDKDMLQVDALPAEAVKAPGKPSPRLGAGARFFGFVGGNGGVVFDWDLKTSLDGLYAAGEQLSGGGDYAASATTGRYAGRIAAKYSSEITSSAVNREQIESEKIRIYKSVRISDGMGWKELQLGLCRIMQEYCGDYRNKETLDIGLQWLKDISENEVLKTCARNPHELQRTLECMVRLSVGEIVMQASLLRKASSKGLDFKRIDYPSIDPPEWEKYVTLKLVDEKIKEGELPFDYWLLAPNKPTYKDNYESHSRL